MVDEWPPIPGGDGSEGGGGGGGSGVTSLTADLGDGGLTTTIDKSTGDVTVGIRQIPALTILGNNTDFPANPQFIDPGVVVAMLGAAIQSTKISTGTGLEGGGDLSADRTLSLAPIPDQSVLGNISGASAAPISMNGVDLLALSGGASSSRTITGTGMLTGGGDLTIDRTLNLASIADLRVLGNVSGSSATPSALTPTQLTTLVNTFTSSLSGAAPASGGGTTNFLRADGSWAAPTSSSITVPSGFDVPSPTAGSIYYNGSSLKYVKPASYLYDTGGDTAKIYNIRTMVPPRQTAPYFGNITFGDATNNAAYATLAIHSNGRLYRANDSASSTINWWDVPNLTVRGTTTIPSGSSVIARLVLGPDGSLWYTNNTNSKIGKIDASNNATEYSTITSAALPFDICVGPDGNLWGTYQKVGTKTIFKCTTSGTITEYTLATTLQPKGICAGPDGNLYITEYSNSGTNYIAKVSTSGVLLNEYATTTGTLGLMSIVVGADGNLYTAGTIAAKIIKLTTGGTLTEYNQGTAAANKLGSILAHSDGFIYITFGSIPGMLQWDPVTTTLKSVTTNTSVNLVSLCRSEDDQSLYASTTTGTSLVKLSPDIPVSAFSIPYGSTSARVASGYAQIAGIRYNTTTGIPEISTGTALATLRGIATIQLKDSTYDDPELLLVPADSNSNRPATPAGPGLRFSSAHSFDTINRYFLEFYNASLAGYEKIQSSAPVSFYIDRMGGSGTGGAYAIAQGADGNLWIAKGASISKVGTALNSTETAYAVTPSVVAMLYNPADGNIWFGGSSTIGKMNTAGTKTEYSVTGRSFQSTPTANTMVTIGGHLYYAGSTSATIYKVDYTNGTASTVVSTTIGTVIAMTTDGTDIYTLNNSGTVYKVTTGGTTTSLFSTFSPTDICYSKFDNCLYVSGASGVYRWSLGDESNGLSGNRSSGTSLSIPANVKRVIVGPDGFMYLYIYSTATANGICRITPNGSVQFMPVRSGSFSSASSLWCVGTDGCLYMNNGNASSAITKIKFYGDRNFCSLDPFVLPGATSGSLEWSMPSQGTYKRFLVYFSAITDSGKTITFPTPFTRTPKIVGTDPTSGVTVSATQLTIPATTAISGYLILEGT